MCNWPSGLTALVYYELCAKLNIKSMCGINEVFWILSVINFIKPGQSTKPLSEIFPQYNVKY